MGFEAFRNLQRRVAEALRISTQLRQQTRPHLSARDWAQIHEHVTGALGLLDSSFSEPEWRLVRSRLIREATCACVHVRLQQADPLRASLQAMLIDAIQLPIVGESGNPALELRRSIQLALTLCVSDPA